MEMDGHDNILVLKLSEGKDLPVERIGQLANGRWKINAIKIQTVKKVIVMIQQEVIADFSLGDTLTIELKNQGRITNLGLVDSKNATGLVGHILDYRTANPATIKTLNELKNLIK